MDNTHMQFFKDEHCPDTCGRESKSRPVSYCVALQGVEGATHTSSLACTMLHGSPSPSAMPRATAAVKF